jgi:carboxylate-amine ligase
VRRYQQKPQKLATLRRIVAETADGYGYHIIAASFLPTGTNRSTPIKRATMLAADQQTVAGDLLICGIHVHVGIGDDELRIDLMNQVSYFLPHRWCCPRHRPSRGRDTGLLSYRLSVFDELPRTGLPATDAGEYCRHLNMLIGAGLIEDATNLNRDVRPSALFPTLEIRITDVCTRLDDSATIPRLFVSLLSALVRLRRGTSAGAFIPTC